MISDGKLDIYLDGSCPFCQWSRARIEPWDTRGRLQFRDYNDPVVAASAPFSAEQLSAEMHLRTPDGSWLVGFEAWLRILRELPGLAWLGKLLGAPPMRSLGPPAYRWVARHRLLLPGVPAPCSTEVCAPRNRPQQ
jgi:predicted DCC family thiol-disulfide oxidoreductase YuxK